jgi:NADPH:quinone reductase
MKAILVHLFGPPEVMHLEDVPNPVPEKAQILVDVRAAGVNPVDTYIRSGQYAKKPALPYTPGFDAAGIVSAMGPEVMNFKPGDRVFCPGTLTGAYAELCLCAGNQVYRLPDNVSFSQGAAIGVPYGIAYRALFQLGHAVPGMTVLVHGATGGVGVGATQLAANSGLKVIATAGTDEGLKFALQNGANHAVNHSDPAHDDEIMRLTEGKGVNLILELLANVNLGPDLKILAQNGRVVVIGSRGTVEIDPRDLMSREASIQGALFFNATEAERSEIFTAISKGLAGGSLKPIIGEEMSLADAAKAHEVQMQSKKHGKIILVP